MPYCFSRSTVKFQGHTGQKILDFDPNRVFPDCNSSSNTLMVMKWCTKLEGGQKKCPIVFSCDQAARYKWYFPSVCLSVCHTFLPEACFGLRVLSLPACVCVCVRVSVRQSSACPCNNSSTVQARITKFGPEMEKTLVKIPIILWDDWPWTSRSNRT